MPDCLKVGLAPLHVSNHCARRPHLPPQAVAVRVDGTTTTISAKSNEAQFTTQEEDT